MRRRTDRVADVPERLLRFADAEWTGTTYAHRLRAWHQSRTAWATEHGWPTDRLTMLAEYSDLRREAAGMPAWPYSRWNVRRQAVQHPEFADMGL